MHRQTSTRRTYGCRSDGRATPTSRVASCPPPPSAAWLVPCSQSSTQIKGGGSLAAEHGGEWLVLEATRSCSCAAFLCAITSCAEALAPPLCHHVWLGASCAVVMPREKHCIPLVCAGCSLQRCCPVDRVPSTEPSWYFWRGGVYVRRGLHVTKYTTSRLPLIWANHDHEVAQPVAQTTNFGDIKKHARG